MSLETRPDPDLLDELVRLAAVPPATVDVLDRVRADVRREAAREVRRARARVRRRRASYALTLAAAVVAVAVVLGGLRLSTDGGPRVVGQGAAAAVLERAAAATLAQRDPVVGPGQYLRVRLVQESWVSSSSEAGSLLVGRDGQPAVTQERWTRTLWIPRDLDADWVQSQRTEVLRRTTTDPRYDYPAEPPSVLRSPSWSKPGSPNHVPTYDPSWYDGLSRDPQRVLEQLRARSGAEGSGTAYDFSEIYSEVLRSPTAPADVRAAVFEGLATWPDMEVVEDVQTLGGRTGTAIGARGAGFQMVFDDETGLFIGERAVDPDFPEVPGHDAGDATYLTSITREVVDHAPRAVDRAASPG